MNLFDEEAMPAVMKKALQEARASIMARGTLLQMRLGQGAFSLYKAKLVSKELIPVVSALLEDELVVRKHRSFMTMFVAYSESMLSAIATGGYLTDTVVAEVDKAVAESDEDTRKVQQVFMDYLKKLSGD